MKIIVNFALFQLGWFTCVISASNNLEVFAIACVVFVIIIHLLFNSSAWPAELVLLITAGLIGLLVDSSLVFFNVFSANRVIDTAGFAPLWLICMWMLFAITLNHSMAWLKNRLLLASILGAVFAPLAYWAGFRFGALSYSADYTEYTTLLIIGVCWLVVMPALIGLAKLIDTKYSLYRPQQLQQNGVGNGQ